MPTSTPLGQGRSRTADPLTRRELAVAFGQMASTLNWHDAGAQDLIADLGHELRVPIVLQARGEAILNCVS